MDLPVISSSSPANISHATEPVMNFFSSAFLLGSHALQNILGGPKTQTTEAFSTTNVDDFVSAQTPIALERLLCNIGHDGCTASGASPGVVVASPDQSDPPYHYTWTRDSSLVFECVIDRFTHSYDADLQHLIEQYIGAQAAIQGLSNPSGSLSTGTGLGEPKFNVDLTAYEDSWGRPQRDGPALRAIALIEYARWLIDNGYDDTVKDIVWPIARNDLEYVAQYWNGTGFDLWEEVNGSSFFTIALQHRALVEGASMAAELDQECGYSTVAPHILCFLQDFWTSTEGYIDANINTNDGRTGQDANTILASIHTFDPTLGCDAMTFQPCSDKALANLKSVVDSFRWYNINTGIPKGSAIAVGRYAEDVYFDGNPWYLNTLAVAEQLYAALYTWDQTGFIAITKASLPFFQDMAPSVEEGTFKAGSDIYTQLLAAVKSYADGFMAIVAEYLPADGSMSEQFSKDTGHPLGASDLTWSYASFLTAAARRGGIVPRSWANHTTLTLPETCRATSIIGSYSSVVAISFPGNQTPTGGVPAPTTSIPPCATPTSVDVTFQVRARTQFGQTIKIVGDVEELGSWDTVHATSLSASQYTDLDPLWRASVQLKPGQDLEYKYISVNPDGSLVWESDGNRKLVVPKACRETVSKYDTWRG